MLFVKDLIKEPREQRTKHLALDEACLERGGNSTVHRGVLAQFLNTDMPSRVDLCHACNNPGCSNPKHLYWGTRRENVQDAIEAGTYKNAHQRMIDKYGVEYVNTLLVKNLPIEARSRGGKAGKGKKRNCGISPTAEAHVLKT